MVAEEIRRAAEAAPLARLCEVTAALWKAFAAGGLTEAEAEELSGLIEARRAVEKSRHFGDSTGAGRSTAQREHLIGAADRFAKMAKLKPQRPPVRSVSVERRRRLAASGPMPPAMAARFTTGELAVMRIVADEHRDRGSCRLCLDAIAARAGVSRSLAKAAIRQARRLGMVEVVERRRVGAKSLPNVVTVVDREWQAWIKRGRKSPHVEDPSPAAIGGRNLSATNTRVYRKGGGFDREPDSRGVARCGERTPTRQRDREVGRGLDRR